MAKLSIVHCAVLINTLRFLVCNILIDPFACVWVGVLYDIVEIAHGHNEATPPKMHLPMIQVSPMGNHARQRTIAP